MKIFANEIKKLFNPVLIILLFVFIFLYQNSFMAINYWPQWKEGSPWNTELHAELVKMFGPTLSKDELPKLQEFYDGLVSDFEKEMQNSDIFKKQGIVTFEQFCKAEDEIRSKNEPTEDDKILLDEIIRYEFDIEPASTLKFNIQDAGSILSFIDYGYAFATEETIKYRQEFFNTLNRELASLLEEKSRADEMSLIPSTPISIDFSDVLHLSVISYIIIFATVQFVLITDRLRGIYPIAMSTKEGRNIFKIQAAACGFSGLFVGGTACIIYGAVLLNKGADVFLDCPINTFTWDF